MINKILTHLRNGTFLRVLKEKIRFEIGIKEKVSLSRWGADSEEKATAFLALRAGEIADKKNKHVIYVVISDGTSSNSFLKNFKLSGRELRTIKLESLQDLLNQPWLDIACIVSSFFDAENTMRIGRFLTVHESMREIPYEYILLPQIDFKRVKGVDRYSDYSFTSPLFADKIDFLKIYEESLSRFEQKCDVRDYMDLCQLLGNIVKNKIPGGVAEFGSYRGHSGYLITQTLSKLGEEKDIFLFDMFEEFPPENLGVDYFWDEHLVNFEEVKSKFSGFRNVQLVKGDFTETIRNFPDLKLSFIFIDCDSYRATKFLVNHLYEKHLSPGGLLVIEDYGHPALLGSRLAVHECFDNRRNCFTFYSQFSGFYVAAKNYELS